MKNMTLPVRNFKSGLHHITVGLCSLGIALILMSGCKERNQPTPSESLKGNTPRPEWTAPADYDYTSSMTAVIKVDLSSQFTEATDFAIDAKDLIAAFCGNECLGVAEQKEGLFYLYICAPKQSAEEAPMVRFRYYSGLYSDIFVAKDAFAYKNDAILGTPEPLLLQWEIDKQQ